MSANEVMEYTDESLCILVKIKESLCAIHSSYVESLFLLEQDITHAPDSNEAKLGIIPYRDQVLPLFDLRPMMGLEARAKEQEAFEAMLDQRKQDHIRWVDELKRCLRTRETFQLATDPHNCAFGKWYYNFKAQNPSIEYQLRKIEEPHAKLHQSAQDSLACMCHEHAEDRAECLEKALRTGADYYMPQVLTLLDETKQTFRDNYRQMVVVVSDSEGACGVLVDEVVAVETLHLVKRFEEYSASGERQLVLGAAQRETDATLILLLSGKKLLETKAEVRSA